MAKPTKQNQNGWRATVRHDVLHLEFDLPTSDSEQWVLVRSDAHHDAEHTDTAMELRHLQQARERNAAVLDCGDLFDAMQGPKDPRQSRRAIRNEDDAAEYFNQLSCEAAEFYAPFADLIAMLAPGNHETAPIRHYGFDLTHMLATLLGYKTGHTPNLMPYSGWVKFRAHMHGTKRGSMVMRYTHGSGGGGPVTRGAIKGQRIAEQYDADLYYFGHIHEKWMMDRTQQRLSKSGRIHNRPRWVCVAPGYKDCSKDGNSWEQAMGMPPKAKGALWLRFGVAGNQLTCTPSWAD